MPANPGPQGHSLLRPQKAACSQGQRWRRLRPGKAAATGLVSGVRPRRPRSEGSTMAASPSQRPQPAGRFRRATKCSNQQLLITSGSSNQGHPFVVQLGQPGSAAHGKRQGDLSPPPPSRRLCGPCAHQADPTHVGWPQALGQPGFQWVRTDSGRSTRRSSSSNRAPGRCFWFGIAAKLQ